MTHSELAHLELLAEVDSLGEQLTGWTDGAPRWEPARQVSALGRRLIERIDSLRVRLESPLVVATLGGTGTGKSALLNALAGTQVVRTGRQRPTTVRPALVARPGLTPEMLGIDPKSVDLVSRDLPALANLVLVDCPDPDTTEQPDAPATNLARLRQILPHCDVLLVTTTQQKYRSARVAEELTAAASGARLGFVQTHADTDRDIRDDWRQVLHKQHAKKGPGLICAKHPPGRSGKLNLVPFSAPKHLFLVDSLAALADAEAGIEPGGEFAVLVDLLTRQLAGAAAVRIRRANFLDLVAETLASCGRRIEAYSAQIDRLKQAVDQQRAKLAARLAGQMRAELLANRRQWENRLLGKTSSRWGLSPCSLVLRVYQGLGGLLTGALLWRARTPAQMALWGTVAGVQTWQRRQGSRKAEAAATRAVAGCWDRAELQAAALVLDGYAAEAGLARESTQAETVLAEAADAAETFTAGASAELESVIDQLSRRHTGWFTRWRYELMLLAMLGLLLYRLGKNFFWDSWLAADPVAVFGLDFYLSAAFWLILWCLILLWVFTGRLRRGLRRQIDRLSESWNNPGSAAGLFAQLEAEIHKAEQFGHQLDRLKQKVARLRDELNDGPLSANNQ